MGNYNKNRNVMPRSQGEDLQNIVKFSRPLSMPPAVSSTSFLSGFQSKQ